MKKFTSESIKKIAGKEPESLIIATKANFWGKVILLHNSSQKNALTNWI